MLQDAGCQAVFLPKSLYHTPSSISNNDPNASMVVKVSGSGTTTDINNDNNNNNNNNNNINDDSHETWVTVERLSQGLCASSRPHFFRGVCTIVAKLFNIVDPDMAFFGKKDYQQWRVIERMARDLDFPIKVVGMPIQREADGLAMSSRNAMLTPKKRAAAPCIYKALQQAVESVEKERKNNNNIKNSMPMEEVVEPVKAAIQAGGGVVDYVQCVDGESLKPVKTIGSRLTLLAVAAHFGSVRLIDNIEIPA
jgi:pantoate--beta-alanine ligase